MDIRSYFTRVTWFVINFYLLLIVISISKMNFWLLGKNDSIFYLLIFLFKFIAIKQKRMKKIKNIVDIIRFVNNIRIKKGVNVYICVSFFKENLTELFSHVFRLQNQRNVVFILCAVSGKSFGERAAVPPMHVPSRILPIEMPNWHVSHGRRLRWGILRDVPRKSAAGAPASFSPTPAIGKGKKMSLFILLSITEVSFKKYILINI